MPSPRLRQRQHPAMLSPGLLLPFRRRPLLRPLRSRLLPLQGPAAQGASGASPASAAHSPTPAPPAGAAKAKIEVPGGTHIPLVLHNAISTRSARPGDPVYFETLFPIMIDGHVVIPAGSYVSGEVSESKRPGKVKGRGELMIRLKTLI